MNGPDLSLCHKLRQFAIRAGCLAVGLAGLGLALTASAIAQDAEAASSPRIWLFFGRFHPAVLHLPIGMLAVGFP